MYIYKQEHCPTHESFSSSVILQECHSASSMFPCSSACQGSRQKENAARCHQRTTSGFPCGQRALLLEQGVVIIKMQGMVKGVAVRYYRSSGKQMVSNLAVTCGNPIIIHFLKLSHSKKNIWFRETHRTETHQKARNRSV